MLGCYPHAMPKDKNLRFNNTCNAAAKQLDKRENLWFFNVMHAWCITYKHKCLSYNIQAQSFVLDNN